MTDKTENYTLINGEQLNKEHPDTFLMPEREKRECIAIGVHCKIGFQFPTGFTERMWVLVTGRTDDEYVGTLDNDPAVAKTIKHGDLVSFKAEHILDQMMFEKAVNNIGKEETNFAKRSIFCDVDDQFVKTIIEIWKPRYKVVDGSDSGHCCFESTVLDTHNDNRNISESFDGADADKICLALNIMELKNG